MDAHKQRTSRLPLILAIVVLLLPVLYVASYLALVLPTAFHGFVDGYPYRMGGEFSARAFWPLEQIDRRVRRNSWLAEVQPTRAY